MSTLFHRPKGPRIQAAPEPVEEVAVIEEEAEEVRRREKKKLLAGGRRATIMGGIQRALAASLKKRLGE